MEDNKKIMITSMSNCRIVVSLPELHFQRTWEGRGVKKPVSWEVLQEAVYNRGFEYMIKEGMLYIEDKDARIELGFEAASEDEEPIVPIAPKFGEAEMKRMATVMPFIDFKTELDKLSYEQVHNLADYMIRSEKADLAKADLIKRKIDIDILKAIQLNHEEVK